MKRYTKNGTPMRAVMIPTGVFEGAWILHLNQTFE